MTSLRGRSSAVALALALGVASLAAGDAAAQEAAATQPLTVLDRDHHAFARPDGRSARVTTVAALRPISGARTVLPILAATTGEDGRRWLKVLLPGRPNGARGWIAARETRRATTSWLLRVDTSQRTVTVVLEGRPVRVMRAVVGAASTPTPHGRFFVEETVRLTSARVGAPFALALSARSDVLDQFDGGPGQIALHGLGNVGGVLGTAVSHGCVRLDRRAISWLAARIRPGTPVTIVP
jgi:lipoprotein-anchoring transpeptidase ErfK/SrfK